MLMKMKMDAELGKTREKMGSQAGSQAICGKELWSEMFIKNIDILKEFSCLISSNELTNERTKLRKERERERDIEMKGRER